MFPLGYLTQWRILLACRQLLMGESITQVALGAGYSGSVAFSRAFEREFGVSLGVGLKISGSRLPQHSCECA
ncbi:helix-turn-helix domain-containing protein [Aeromonas sp. MdU4]|uniref:helix-turn-helix domain-containing protein n=1 Tax=Aeromonas sp. MdU4 TaxID=3342819 RepID=UPI0035B97B73